MVQARKERLECIERITLNDTKKCTTNTLYMHKATRDNFCNTCETTSNWNHFTKTQKTKCILWRSVLAHELINTKQLSPDLQSWSLISRHAYQMHLHMHMHAHVEPPHASPHVQLALFTPFFRQGLTGPYRWTRGFVLKQPHLFFFAPDLIAGDF